jgi:predicted RNA binding protein YcfA (HicA-like mRNA interferase family)
MSDIDYSPLRSLTARDLCRALVQDGFVFTRQRGSQHRYAHPDGRRVTVPFTRQGDTVAAGTLRSILERQARWTEHDLRRLGLLA